MYLCNPLIYPLPTFKNWRKQPPPILVTTPSLCIDYDICNILENVKSIFNLLFFRYDEIRNLDDDIFSLEVHFTLIVRRLYNGLCNFPQSIYMYICTLAYTDSVFIRL